MFTVDQILIGQCIFPCGERTWFICWKASSIGL